ncbi:MAG: hypothetical protein ACREVL_14000 [Solimonas sp.]
MIAARLLLSALALGFSCAYAATAGVADPAPAAGSGDAAAWCQQHPDRCEKARERIKEKCDADPAKCEEARQKLQEKAAECEKNPDACKQERRDKLEAACKANPDRPICKRMATPAPAPAQ